jgi:hypothetical protein
MANVGEEKTVNKLILNWGGNDYVISGGGGGGVPGPNTVGTEQIIDGAVEEQDLNDHVKSRMTVTHDSSSGGLRIGGYAKPGEIPADNEPVGQGGGEDTDDDETGFDAGADNGDEDI